MTRRIAAMRPGPAHHADARAHLLHGDHHRERDQRDPQQTVAEARSGDGIGGDPRGIVVGRTSDDPGTDLAQEIGRLFHCHSRLRFPATLRLNLDLRG